MKFHGTAVMVIALLAVVIAVGCNRNEAETPAVQASKPIAWLTDMDEALALAGAQHKPLMVDFMATWCPPCNMMEDSTFTDPRVIEKAEAFITVRIDVDKQGDVANHYKANASKYGGVGIPNILFMDAHGHSLRHPVGYQGPEVFLAMMDSVLTLAANHHH